jgi:hypothetical protein
MGIAPFPPPLLPAPMPAGPDDSEPSSRSSRSPPRMMAIKTKAWTTIERSSAESSGRPR